jgi:formylglycine-generating enzyme required for sulfatase activity
VGLGEPAAIQRPEQQNRALKPKDTLQECSNCPEMIVVPAGSFTMGSRDRATGIALRSARRTRNRAEVARFDRTGCLAW